MHLPIARILRFATNTNAPRDSNLPSHNQSEGTPDALVVFSRAHQPRPSRPVLGMFTRPKSIAEILPVTRSQLVSIVQCSRVCGLFQVAGSVRMGGVHRQLGTSTNAADHIQTCNGGSEASDGTKRWYVSISSHTVGLVRDAGTVGEVVT